jgi:ribonuclease HI
VPLSDRNKVTLLWVSGHSGFQGGEDSDAFARKG